MDNDFDFDGDALTVTGGIFTGTYGTLTLNANGTYSYTLFASAQALAQGENVQDSFNYTVSDNDGSDTGTLVFHIAGLNDAPIANPDAATTGENAVDPDRRARQRHRRRQWRGADRHRRLGAGRPGHGQRSSATRSSSIRAPISTTSRSARARTSSSATTIERRAWRDGLLDAHHHRHRRQ